MNLELEYVCSDTELEEASSLASRVAIGGGSKWRSRLILFAVYAVLLFGFDLQLRRSLELPARLCILAGVAATSVVLRLTRRRPKRGPPPPPIRIEVSETDLTFVNDGIRVTMPSVSYTHLTL